MVAPWWRLVPYGARTPWERTIPIPSGTATPMRGPQRGPAKPSSLLSAVGVPNGGVGGGCHPQTQIPPHRSPHLRPSPAQLPREEAVASLLEGHPAPSAGRCLLPYREGGGGGGWGSERWWGGRVGGHPKKPPSSLTAQPGDEQQAAQQDEPQRPHRSHISLFLGRGDGGRMGGAEPPPHGGSTGGAMGDPQNNSVVGAGEAIGCSWGGGGFWGGPAVRWHEGGRGATGVREGV